MAEPRKLTVAEALEHAELIEGALDRFEETAPHAVKALGGRDVLAACSEMTCIGPVPRLDQETWAAMSREFQEQRDWEAREAANGL
ncbi:MAG: hypothetical protein QHC78_17365 [Pigmentiphaga sp.]|uniref:hypothetical protein n=1 Tax=Pigmentiphaga sp. TaxID=1977564 RepID=UPI0029BB10F1|nr:hypothetical protein [Pigmentiphaga sp.]MDX3907462.1 hypothetical protein [Pigmentiphaga sp.]